METILREVSCDLSLSNMWKSSKKALKSRLGKKSFKYLKRNQLTFQNTSQKHFFKPETLMCVHLTRKSLSMAQILP